MEQALKRWVAQSESWHTFIDFDLPEKYIAKYPFLERFDDFYVSLIGQLFNLLNESDPDKNDCLSAAKGLEIFSLEHTRGKFKGVHYYDNLLFATGLYYLAGYSASAYLLSSLFPLTSYKSDLAVFISSYLRRDLTSHDVYTGLLRQFLKEGDITKIHELSELLRNGRERAFENDPFEYLRFKLSVALIDRFKGENIWHDLLRHNKKDHWQKYIEISLSRKPPVWDFFPSQKIALEKGILGGNKCITLQMPTSSGKTALCELLVYDEINKNPDSKILFLAPYRSLASELKEGLAKGLARLGIKSKTIYGGNIPTSEEKAAVDTVSLLISTPEKLLAFGHMFEDFISSFSVIICDEGHLIDDQERGLRYELLLTSLKGASGGDKRFVFLSAIIPNLSDINKWLGGDDSTLILSDYRPARLNYAFLEEMVRVKKAYQLIVNPTKAMPEKYIVSYFLSPDDFKYINKKTGRKNTYDYGSKRARSVATAMKALRAGAVALFAPSKGKTGVKGLAEEVINQVSCGIPSAATLTSVNKKLIARMKEYFKAVFGDSYLLTRLVDHGVVYHHGDLPQNVREVIENSVRDGLVKFIICTNTLAEGVNLPIRTVVVHSARRYIPNVGWVHLRVRDLKNLGGRAGRAGKETDGMIVVTNPEDFNAFRHVIEERGNEPAYGHLFRVVKSITDIIIEKRLKLSNQLLEAQDEEFKQLLDAIDISIIDLLAEELPVDELEAAVSSVIENTFAFFQSSEDQKETLRSLMSLRGERIRPYVESGQFPVIRRSGANLRTFEEFVKRVDFSDDIWVEENDPISLQLLESVLEIVLSLPMTQYEISKFNTTNNTAFTDQSIAKIIKSWVIGEWYGEIARKSSADVETILKLFSSFIGFFLQNYVTNLIRIIEEQRSKDDKEVSSTLAYLPLYLTYGFQCKAEIDLTDIGFTDRFAAKKIAEWLESRAFEYKKMTSLRQFIVRNKKDVDSYIKGAIPAISYQKFKENLDFLEARNIM